MSANLPQLPQYLRRHFIATRKPYGADLSNVVEKIAFTTSIEIAAANKFPVFAATKRA